MKTNLLLQMACAALMIYSFTLSRGAAAEISCAATWETDYEMRGLNWDKPDPSWAELYPSGRRPKPTTCYTLLLKGALRSGDSEIFLKVLSVHHPFVRTVLLWSPGGSVVEAMKIGRMVRKNMLKTWAPTELDANGLGHLYDPTSDPLSRNTRDLCDGEGCNCASACFLIWASGIERYGSALGLHRPTTNSTDFTDLPPDRGSSAYREILSGVEQFLLEMEVPQRFIDKMTGTASNNVSWLIWEDQESLQEVSSISELLLASCGSLSRDERDFSYQVNDRQRAKMALSERQQSLRDRVRQHQDAINKCREIKIEAFRDSSPSPRIN
jgi:hypothetical protein